MCERLYVYAKLLRDRMIALSVTFTSTFDLDSWWWFTINDQHCPNYLYRSSRDSTS